jgi:signal peptidase I
MENLNNILYILLGVLTLVEVFLRWGMPRLRKEPKWAGTVETVDSLWIALAAALALKAVLLQPFTIPSGSMEDTLLVGDYIFVKKYEYGYTFLNRTERFLDFKKPQRGEVVVFVFPEDRSKDYIKRCVGVPGDVLEMKDKVFFVNGERPEEPYAKHIDPHIFPVSDYFSGWRDNWGPVTVQAGHYFMMGDNRDNSLDSRKWGQLDEKLVKGRAWFVYWHSRNFKPDFGKMLRWIR